MTATIILIWEFVEEGRGINMHLKDQNVLVTGGAGFIGSHLVDALADCRVRVLDDFSTGREDNLAHHGTSCSVDIVRGDIRDDRTVASAMDGIDVVFHLACRGVRPVHIKKSLLGRRRQHCPGNTLYGAPHLPGVLPGGRRQRGQDNCDTPGHG